MHPNELQIYVLKKIFPHTFLCKLLCFLYRDGPDVPNTTGLCETASILWRLKSLRFSRNFHSPVEKNFHWRFRVILRLEFILIKLNPVHIIISYAFTIHIAFLVLFSMSNFQLIFYVFIKSTIRVHALHIVLFVIVDVSVEEYKLWVPVYFNHRPITLCLLHPYISINTAFSRALRIVFHWSQTTSITSTQKKM
jgi:hypothetical protein